MISHDWFLDHCILSLSMAYRLPIIVRTAALILLQQQYKASSQQCLRAFEWSLHLCREQLHKRELYYVVILLENYVFICAERSCDASTPHPLLTPHMFTLSQRKQELWMHGVANFPCWHDHVGKAFVILESQIKVTFGSDENWKAEVKWMFEVEMKMKLDWTFENWGHQNIKRSFVRRQFLFDLFLATSSRLWGQSPLRIE